MYATSARLGGSGLDAVALESVRVAHAGHFLGQAIAFDTRRSGLPASRARSLRWHPIRLLSWLESEYYYGAKKHAVDRVSARELTRAGGRYDLFHGWSGDCVRTLRAARELGVPSLLEIPTWHRHKGKEKPARLTKSERERAEARGWQRWKNEQLISRQQMLEEYELADLILVLSQKAEETFLAAGIPPEKLFRHQRGVDVERFHPAPKPPAKFKAGFVGALIKRKGVHHLLEVWRRLALPDAELWLAGTVHDEILPYLNAHRPFKLGADNIYPLGFTSDVPAFYRDLTVHLFPSECEGSAKATYEAAASGLPQITTRESGDVVINGVNGLIIPPNDPDALAAAILCLYRDPELRAKLGAAGRERAVKELTWEHFRTRLRQAYDRVLCLRNA